jgi:hypothetical protein
MKEDIINDIISEIRKSNDMIPEEHDGSYKLVKEVIKILSKYNIEKLTLSELNLIYFMTI